MTQKWHNQLKILNYIISTELFKVLFFLLIILSLYGSVLLGGSVHNFIDAILVPFQFPMFNLFMFTLLFLNTINTASILDKKFSFYTIRLKTKKVYLKEVLKNVLIMNLFLLVIFFLFFFIILNMAKFGNVGVHAHQDYNISNLLYTLFYLIRYVLLSLLFCTMVTMILINFKEKITVLMCLLFLSGFILTPFSADARETLALLPWQYFMGIRYASFMTEVSLSILFVFIIELLIYLGFKLTLKNKRWTIS